MSAEPGNMADGAHNNEEVWTCKGCRKDSKTSKSKLNWIVCAGCEATFEIKCQGLKAADYTALKSRDDILWLCPECLIVMCPKIGVISKLNLPTQVTSEPDLEDIMSQVRVLQVKLESLGNTQLAMKTTLDGLQTDVMEQLPTDLKEQLENKVDKAEDSLADKIADLAKQIPNPKTWANILKQDAPAAPQKITVECLKQALVEAKDVDEEQEIRSRGIVVYRAKEKIWPNEEANGSFAQKAEDDALIKNLLTFLDCNVDDLESVNRLGNFSAEKITQSRFRPLKVRFSSQEARDKVLQSLSKLRKAPPELNILSIRQDLNYYQRKELNEKIKEARELSADREDSVFRVRGSPGNYYLLEIKKKVPFLANQNQ